MIKVGISGKIASGKSEVERIIKEKGYLVFDLDIISHELLEKNDNVKTLILEEFNTLNRKKIGEIVFSDSNKKTKLENIIYPEMKKIIFDIFEKYKNEKAIFISGALLFKSNFAEFFDKTIFVDAIESVRLERLMKRNNLNEAQARMRLNLQDDSALADFVVVNDGTIEDLKVEIEKLFEEIFV